jgi:hypothetical protein
MAIPKEGFSKKKMDDTAQSSPGHRRAPFFKYLEGFPLNWQSNEPAFIKFVRDHQCPSFLEYGECPL